MRKVALACLLLALRPRASAITVATVGDSFADAFYLGMKARPDLVRQREIILRRWSRPIIGVARSDYFDYPGWLRDADLGMADVCFVQIGTNDMQAISLSAGHWMLFGSPPWKQEYGRRIRSLADNLRRQHCRQVLWVLQPGFEKRTFLACNGPTINQLQCDALNGTGIWILRMMTGPEAYGVDNIHYNRDFELALGQAAFRLVELERQMTARKCLMCHGSLSVGKAIAEPEIYPLGFWRAGRPAVQQIACATPAPSRPAHRHRRLRPVAGFHSTR
jgi:hypothetical protein